ncbi:MAG: DUF4174 domain-containing protein [Pararhodobacter sp.]|nr:DUF4174 domain-containing protein [Pararhodobacter sp.]
MRHSLAASIIAILPVLAVTAPAARTLPGEDALILAAEVLPDAAAEVAEGEADEAETPEGLRIIDAAGVEIEDFIWEWRILAVMADTPSDPAFIRQMRDIAERADDLYERDVVVITDTDRNSDSALRRMLRPRGFMLAIIDKDGEVKQRRPAPRSVRELNAVIDRFPLRRQEMMERRPSGRD